MKANSRRTFVLSAAAITAGTLAGCGGGSDSPADPGGGGGGGGGVTETLSSLTPSVTQMVAFVGDTKKLSVTGTAINGTPVAAPAVTWSSSNPAVATVDPSGNVTVRSVGATTITAKSVTVEAAVPVQVNAVPASLAALVAAFPFKATGTNGNAASDISTAFTGTQQPMLDRVNAAVTARMPDPGTPLDFYYTSDAALLKTHAARIAGLTAQQTAEVTNLVQYFDGSRVASFAYIEPNTSPQRMALHDVAESSFDSTVLRGTPNIDPRIFGWLREGLGLWFESGSFDASGAFSVTQLRPELLAQFKSGYSEQTAAVGVLKTMNYDQLIGTLAYPSSMVLVHYLKTMHAAKLVQLLDELAAGGAIAAANGGGSWPVTQAGLMARVVQLTGMGTEAALTTAYSNFGLNL
jgi:hypothetical protein